MRRIVATAALAVVLLGTPHPTEAQVFKRFCDSPALNWCFNAITLDYLESVHGDGTSDYTFTATGFLSGPAVFATLPLVQWGVAVFPTGFLFGGTSRVMLAPGTTTTRTMVATAASGFAPSDVDWRFYWDDEPASPPAYSAGLCGGSGPPPAGTAAACHVVTVPEPAGWALMFTGLVVIGLVGVGRRPRRGNAA